MKKEKSELEKDLDYYKRKSEWFSKIIAKYQEENKKLKEDLAYERTMLDNVRAEYESLQNVIKNLKEELKWWEDLVHKAKEFEYDEDGMDYIYQNTDNL